MNLKLRGSVGFLALSLAKRALPLRGLVMPNESDEKANGAGERRWL